MKIPFMGHFYDAEDLKLILKELPKKAEIYRNKRNAKDFADSVKRNAESIMSADDFDPALYRGFTLDSMDLRECSSESPG